MAGKPNFSNVQGAGSSSAPDTSVDAVIQRMIDAGESEENIGTYVQHMAEQAKIKPVTSTDSGIGLGHDPLANLVNRVSPGTGDWLEGAVAGGNEGMRHGAVGAAKSVVPGLVEGVKQTVMLPVTLGKGLMSAGEGAYHLYKDPKKVSRQAGSDFADMVTGAPGKVSDAVSAAATKATLHPEEYGSDVGYATGAAEAGVLAAHAVPMLPKPIARSVGTIMEKAGTATQFPSVIVGAHQLASGDLKGFGTIGLPHVIRKTGTKLKEWGEPKSQATGSVRWNTPEEMEALRAARPTEPHMDLSRQVPAGSMTPAQMKERMAAVKAQGGFDGAAEPAKPPITGTPRQQPPAAVSTPVEEVVTPREMPTQLALPGDARIVPATDSVVPKSVRILGEAPKPTNGNGNNGNRAGVAPGEGFGSRKTPGTKAEKITESSGSDFDRYMEDRYGADGPLPRINAQGHGTMPAEPQTAPKAAPAASKSKLKSHQVSATPGYSKNSLASVGLDPDVDHTAFLARNPQLAAKMDEFKASRATTNYETAKQDKHLRSQGYPTGRSELDESALEMLRKSIVDRSKK